MDVNAHKISALDAILAATNAAELDAIRVAYLGKKGHITSLMKTLGAMDPDERKQAGQQINSAKDEVTKAVAQRKITLDTAALNARLSEEKEDVTIPARPSAQGHAHLISQTIDELLDILTPMGFSVEDGPQIEDDFHNFTALNIPKNHPARQMQDTFYIKNDTKGSALADQAKAESPEAAESYVLRTQTSSVQIRAMKNGTPPFKFVAPGRVYRSDYDMTHTPMFHQIEGLYIDKEIHMGHLKGCLQTLLETFFEVDHLPLRFRPSFFPFTEPSAEVDIGCARSAETVSVGKGDDWLEVLGCGMVHPNVLKNAGIDPDVYQGFAFGVGIERLAMLKYGAPDLREFFAGDNRWLNHYGFALSDMA